jgi:cell division protease FtsH
MDDQPKQSPPGGDEKGAKPRPRGPGLWLILVLLAVTVVFLLTSRQEPRSEIDYSFFRQQVSAGNIVEVEFRDQRVLGTFKDPPMAPPSEDAAADEKTSSAKLLKEFVVTLSPLVGEDLDKLLLDKGVQVKAHRQGDYTGLMMTAWLAVTVLLFVFMWTMFRRTRDQFLGGGIFSGFAKSPARRYDTDTQPITFDDVAGLEGVKRDLEEVVEFLKNPEKFQRLGGRVPKGVLLMGPPGTGKTLLGRAVAGEAEVPFFSINGSEFIQMFVGVGAGRVRDMFKTAKENSPAILFIDEIDAVGRQRGAGLGGGHDEREQTLNQILSEMDGFSQHESVIVLAATNRPDVLDPALLRPGRFDRHITVDRPNRKGRRQIFNVHTREVTLADDVDLDRLAGGTVGMTGADIRNLVNEAALWATRHDKDAVTMSDFEHARDKVLMGPKREEVLTPKEKRMTAFHEAGHALLAWIVPGTDMVHKVTIIPRGRALGVTQLLPQEDRLNIGESDLHSRLVFMLGGRAAEKLTFDEFSAGAENDLKEATRLARRMVTHWGMSQRIGSVAYRTSEEHPFLGREIVQEHREFSEHTAQVIDEEVARILHAANDRAYGLLEEHREELTALATALEEQEVLGEAEIEVILGPSVNQLVPPAEVAKEDRAESK